MSKIVRAHTNIALLKYWGKANSDLKIPHNSSISLTLNEFYTDTRVTYDDSLDRDVFYLDDEVVDDKVAKRVYQYMDRIRSMFDIKSYAKIESWNHVPKEAGLASSASAFAALAKAATLDFDLSNEELSKLARLGSGSASRSIYPGFVKWNRGSNHENSFAEPLDVSPWDDFRMIVCIINDQIKPYSSSTAMDITAKESPYYPAWVENTEKTADLIEEAIRNQDIWTLGKLAQTNALQMHASLMAVNMWYFEPKTLEIMNRLRDLQKEVPAFFTMDAGPNVKIMTTQEHVDTVLKSLPDGIETVVCRSGEGIKVL